MDVVLIAMSHGRPPISRSTPGHLKIACRVASSHRCTIPANTARPPNCRVDGCQVSGFQRDPSQLARRTKKASRVRFLAVASVRSALACAPIGPANDPASCPHQPEAPSGDAPYAGTSLARLVFLPAIALKLDFGRVCQCPKGDLEGNIGIVAQYLQGGRSATGRQCLQISN
jgi:hypothetical protein